MEKYQTAEKLLEQLDCYRSIHIECNHEISKEILEIVRSLGKSNKTAYILHTDKGYERKKIRSYLKFWADITGGKFSVDKVLERFGLTGISGKKMQELTPGENMQVQIARVSMQEAQIYYLEEPLMNLDSQGMAKVLEWIAGCFEDNIRFITVNASLRHALLMPGMAFYLENGSFCRVEKEEEELAVLEEGEIRILKIAARTGNSTLLFEPKDIDFAESMNKHNYISVRGILYQVNHNMDELEKLLGKSGFYRCHRSYLVNMQKVEQIERLSKNSFALLLDNQEQSRIPLSKGRVEDMKATFGW